MKNFNYIYITALGVILVLISSSCGDFLDEDPRSFLSPENFYETESQATAAIIGVYDVMDGAEMHGQQGLIAIGDVAADNLTADGLLLVSKGENPLSYEIDPGDTRILDFYESSYRLINRANAVIDQLADSPIEEDFKLKIVAEAKFLRGYTYFTLVRVFGGVVLQLNESASLSGLDQSRATEDETYASIISDLDEAASILPDEPLGTGRAHKWAAMALLAKVHLTRANYDQAAALTGEIINAGRFSLVSAYNTLFRPENTSLTEEILFAVQYGPQRNNNLIDFLTPAETSAFGPVFSVMEETFPVDLLYEAGDVRKDMTVYDSILWQGEWVVPAAGKSFLKFAEEHLVDGVPEGQSGTMDYPVLRYADVLLMHAEALNEQNNGPTQAAYDAINEVRARARLSGLSGLSYEEFRSALLLERRLEFVLEGHRWFDLKRFNKLDEVMSVHDGWAQRYLLFPIPETAFTANPNLTQNEGY